jgi:hypothetical protein
MNDFYPVQYQKSNSHQFWFVSNGRKNILKCVQLDVMDSNRNYFHLSLLDYDENSGLLRDDVVSNNGDTSKVLWTVFHCTQLFITRFPNAKITFTGNSSSRDRLFRRQINSNLPKISELLQVQIQEVKNDCLIFNISRRK